MTRDKIKDILTEYMLGRMSSNMAIFINGPWGTGKTYLIKEIISTEQFIKNVTYVTLFGLKSVEELHARIVIAKHSNGLVSTKGQKGIRAALGVALKPLGLSNLVMDGLDALVSMLEMPQGSIIVLDDLERTNIDLLELFGFVNEWIEHKGCRVVLVGYLEKVSAGEKSAFNLHYSKVVGETIDYKGNAKEVLENHVAERERNYKGAYPEVFYRVAPSILLGTSTDIRNAVHVFDRTCDILERVLQHRSWNGNVHTESIAELGRVVAAFTIGHRLGQVSSEELENIGGLSMREAIQRMSHGSAAEVSNEKLFLDRFELVVDLLPVSLETIIAISTSAFIDEDAIVHDIMRNHESKEPDAPKWMQLWWFRRLSTNEEFDKLVRDVTAEWEARAFKEVHVILHVFCILVAVSRIKNMYQEQDHLLNDLVRYVQSTDIHTDGDSLWIDRHASLGLQYMLSIEDTSRQQAERILQEALLESFKNDNKTYANKWPESLAANPKEAMDLLVNGKMEENEELIVVFDSELDVEGMVDVLVGINTVYVPSLVSKFASRYSTVQRSETLQSGMAVFQKIVNILRDKRVEAESSSRWLTLVRVDEVLAASERQLSELESRMKQVRQAT